jgi:4-amino-4-deoxy-L-arabinose transferase-like glycosyltransferase
MSHTTQTKLVWHLQAIIILILLAGFALRVWQLDAQALSGDEAFSILNWTRVSFSHLFGTVAIVDPQPPATLLSLYVWVRVVGDTEFAARMLSVLASTITLASAFTLGRQLLGIKGALLASLLLAVNPFQIWYAQDVRSYSLWIAASTTSLALLVRTIEHPRDSRSRTLYVLTASLAAYTFYLEGFVLIAHNLYALAHIVHQRSRKLLLTWIKTQFTIIAILAPWYIYVALLGRSYRPTAGDPAPVIALRTFLFGTTIPLTLARSFPLPIVLTTGTCLLLAASLWTYWRSRSYPNFVLLLSASLLPVLLLALLAALTGRGYFHPRYVAASAVPLIILIAGLLTMRRSPVRSHVAAIGITGLMLTVSAMSLIHYRYDPSFAKAPPWRDIARLIESQAQPSDLVLRNYPDPSFNYYYSGLVDTRVLPHEQGGSTGETRVDLEALAAEYDYIWFLPVESRIYDRDAIVATWLDQNMDFISEQWIGPTRILQYGSPQRLEPEHRVEAAINFDNSIMLIGYRATPPGAAWERGTTIYLELFWQPIAQTEGSLKIFVHLLGSDHEASQLRAQDDQFPKDGRTSSTDWLLNSVFRDVYQITIPDSAVSGKYYLTVGLYSEASGIRISPLNVENSLEPDAVTLIEFTLP